MSYFYSMSSVLLSIKGLTIQFEQKSQVTKAVDSIDLEIAEGQILGIVGESGSGKSVTSLSVLNLFKNNKSVHLEGSIQYNYNGKRIDLLKTTDSEIQKIRGKQIAMVFQEPMSSLNPVKKCGWQINEVLEIHKITPKEQRRGRVIELLKQVQLVDVDRIYNAYPHELSGGQLQRVNIAMALAGEPEILICDEPTTALDVTVQKEIVDLLRNLTVNLNLTLIFICHDLDLVYQLCDTVIVMYKGKIVESGELPITFDDPQHQYTKALISCKPKSSNRNLVLPTVSAIMQNTYETKSRTVSKELESDIILLRVESLTVDFLLNPLSLFSPKKHFRAVDSVSFELKEGKVLGIVGESGSGKTTLANCMAGIVEHSSGQIFYKDQVINHRVLLKDKKLRRAIQIVFQDPYSSLNPRMSIGNCIQEPIIFYNSNKASAKVEALRLLSIVGLDESYYDRYPHELSGGQRQRVCIARALAVKPDLLICDESVSALDVSIQAQILNLLDRLKEELGLTIIFISHDLSVVDYISDQVIVMKKGQIVESGDTEKVMNDPQDDYTKLLIDSIPTSI